MIIRTVLSLAFVAAVASAQAPRFRVLNEQLPQFDTNIGGAVGGAADFDGDGDLDLLKPTRFLLNDGGGRFTEGPAFASSIVVSAGSGWPQLSAIGDVNGDGFPDVLVGANGGALFLNDGALGLSPGQAIPSFGSGTSSAAVTLGDVDGDGDLDACLVPITVVISPPIAYATPNQPRIWLNDGTGTFTDVTGTMAPAISVAVDHVEMRDFDGDADLDILLWKAYTPFTIPVFPSSPPGQCFLLVNAGGGFFTQTIPISGPGPAAGVAIGNFGGSSLPDLAFSGVALPVPSDGIVLNQGGGVFGAYVATAGSSSPTLLAISGSGTDALVRINGSQIAVGSVGPGGVLNPPSHTFASSATLGVARDLDGDGDTDVVVGGSYEWPRELLNDGTGTLVPITGHFLASQLVPSPTTLTPSVALGDVDGDGDVDCVYLKAPNLVGPTFVVARNDGHGTLVEDPLFCAAGCPFLSPVTQRIFPLDIDADGDLDIYGAGTSDTLFLNTGAAWTPIVSAPLGGFTAAVAQGDLDGDGDPDLVLARRTNADPPYGVGQSYVVWNVAPGVFSPAPLPLSAAPEDVAVFDADGDGDLDIAAADNYTPSLPVSPNSTVLRNDGGGVFTPVPGSFPGFQGTSIAAGDVNGDGYVDLVFSGMHYLGPIGVFVVINDGSGTFVFGGYHPGVLASDLFDADGDGDLDYVSLDQASGTFLRLNDGMGGFATAEPLPAFGPLYKIGPRDLDGDGDPDFIGIGPSVYSDVTRQIARGALARPGRFASLDIYGPPMGAYQLWASSGTASIAAPPFGTVFLDPAPAIQVVSGVFPATGTSSFGAIVPNIPSLVGATLYWQALIPSQLRLTNLEVTTILGI